MTESQTSKGKRQHEHEDEPTSETVQTEVALKAGVQPSTRESLTGSNNCESTTSTQDKHRHFELATLETRAVNILRVLVMVFLIATASLVCTCVYIFTREGETKHFELEYEDNTVRIIKAFHDSVEQKLGAINTLSTQMTSYALYTNKTFPFVTLPNFAVRGADLRLQGKAMIVHWMPLVSDDNREEWEEYALANRHQIDEAYEADKDLRSQQDDFFGVVLGDKSTPSLENGDRELQSPRTLLNETVLDDDTSYHPRIWSIGGVDPRGDYAEGTGPFLPLWQRSPISRAKQALLNMNFGKSRALGGAMEVMMETKQAVMNGVSFPIPAILPVFKANLEISQYRHDVDSVLEDPFTFIAYPVCNILQPSATGVICVLENSFNQTFSYITEGPEAMYIGEGDHHDPQFNRLEQYANINAYVGITAGPKTRSYMAVPLNKDYGKYKLRIYPAFATDYSDRPWIYTTVVASTFAFTAIVFVLFSFAVEKQQKVVTNSAIQNEKRAASTARELNEFLSHEVRNPLSAAISATTFVRSALKETHCITDLELKKSLQDDVKIIFTSLSFVSDFLRSMLDLHRAQGDQIEMKLAPVDLKTDVLEPISNMFYQRNTGVEVIVDCPSNILVVTDCLRIKQVILNLGRNSAKFVEAGFIRFRADVVDGKLEIYVEDSGPGIPEDKQDNLFQKFQTSLDVLNQGTGIGLSLCKTLVNLLEGDIYLDGGYDSGIINSPGARFVIRMSSPLLLDPGNDSIQPSDNRTLDNGDVKDSSIREDEASLPEHMAILFVDDDRMLRKLFSRAIKRLLLSGRYTRLQTERLRSKWWIHTTSISFSWTNTWRPRRELCWAPRLYERCDPKV
jgi:signal transduction histidine kinase